MEEHQVRVDYEHAAAIDTLLLLADAGAGWREYDHALSLLAEAEEAAGALPAEYELKRQIWKAY